MQDDWKYSKETPIPPKRKPAPPREEVDLEAIEDTVLSISDWEVFDPVRARHYVDLADVMLDSDPDEKKEVVKPAA